VLVLTIATILAFVLPGAGNGGGDGTPPSSQPTTSPPTGTALAPNDVHSYDPLSKDADKSEKEGQVRNVIDANPATAWETSSYNDNLGGAFKAGVGFRLEFAQPVTPRQIEIAFGSGPTSFQLLGGDTVTYDVSQYRRAAAADGVTGVRTVPVTADAPHRYWVVWLTSLPMVSGGFKGTVVDVTLRS
jgi:hypothetical protein